MSLRGGQVDKTWRPDSGGLVREVAVDIYSFGMAEPVRLEFWGDDIVELRHFDLNTQRSTRDADLALILPVDVRVEDSDVPVERVTLPDLWPPDALVVMPSGSAVLPELVRTWEEAAHHIELARRRFEEFVKRDTLFMAPPDMASRLACAGSSANGIVTRPNCRTSRIDSTRS